MGGGASEQAVQRRIDESQRKKIFTIKVLVERENRRKPMKSVGSVTTTSATTADRSLGKTKLAAGVLWSVAEDSRRVLNPRSVPPLQRPKWGART